MILLAALLAATAQETPQAAPSPAPSPQTVSRNDPNRISCINRLRTGSRTNFEQICHTQAEWAELRSENRRVVERGQANRGRFGE